ncbi:hypothetical protein LguiA_030091 [Lonicera macranthoides]
MASKSSLGHVQHRMQAAKSRHSMNHKSRIIKGLYPRDPVSHGVIHDDEYELDFAPIFGHQGAGIGSWPKHKSCRTLKYLSDGTNGASFGVRMRELRCPEID